MINIRSIPFFFHPYHQKTQTLYFVRTNSLGIHLIIQWLLECFRDEIGEEEELQSVKIMRNLDRGIELKSNELEFHSINLGGIGFRRSSTWLLSLHQSLGTLQSSPRGYISNVVLNRDYSSGSLRLMANSFIVDDALPRLKTNCSRKRTLIQASASHQQRVDTVYNPLNDSIAEVPSTMQQMIPKRIEYGQYKLVCSTLNFIFLFYCNFLVDDEFAPCLFVFELSPEAALILIRHGESLWNEKNLFTSCVDVPLTQKGVDKAIEDGKRIGNIPVDMIYTSALIRAQMTAMLAMTQHRRKKVLEERRSVMHDESDQAREWSQIFSDESKKQCIPVITAWQLNERICRYGELQGLNNQETADRYGNEKVHEWRRSYDIPPPNGESLEMCAERAVAYFQEHIEPKLLSGKNIVIAAHGNSFLRSIIILELSTGVQMLYVLNEGRFIRRGSPVAPSEAGCMHILRYCYSSYSRYTID
ncbi:hypothetical protein Leryth_015653 [Lithospermum erythrorhizon]|nr:hypothetical protein Leryth_015653 [Lithospermum erythrorhizon]